VSHGRQIFDFEPCLDLEPCLGPEPCPFVLRFRCSSHSNCSGWERADLQDLSWEVAIAHLSHSSTRGVFCPTPGLSHSKFVLHPEIDDPRHSRQHQNQCGLSYKLEQYSILPEHSPKHQSLRLPRKCQNNLQACLRTRPKAPRELVEKRILCSCSINDIMFEYRQARRIAQYKAKTRCTKKGRATKSAART
jgi:hypothetical protein